MAKETDTRIVIDRLLRETGWDIEDKSQVSTEEASADGRADYLLKNQRTQPLAVIETKRFCTDPYSAKLQAKDYAVSLGAPFVILSNGREHYFWEYDTGDARPIIGMPSRTDLERRANLRSTAPARCKRRSILSRCPPASASKAKRSRPGLTSCVACRPPTKPCSPDAGLINGIANNSGGDPNNRLVVPGYPGFSVLLKRVAASDGFGRMPPIGSNVLDAVAIAQLEHWIAKSLPNRQTYATGRVQKFGAGGGGANGEPGADSDGDASNNQSEYLVGTEPGSGASFPNANVTISGSLVTISLHVPADRLVWIETSTDLVTWTRWNVNANNGLPGPAATRTFSGLLTSDRQFFRPVVTED